MAELPPPPAEVEIVVVHPPRLAPLGGEAAFSAVRVAPEVLRIEPRLDDALKTVPGVSLFRRTASGARPRVSTTGSRGDATPTHTSPSEPRAMLSGSARSPGFSDRLGWAATRPFTRTSPSEMRFWAMALLEGWFNSRAAIARIGLSLFTSGFLLSEGILFLQGLLFWLGWGMIPGYYWIIFGVSLLLPVGIAILFSHSSYRRQRLARVEEKAKGRP